MRTRTLTVVSIVAVATAAWVAWSRGRHGIESRHGPSLEVPKAAGGARQEDNNEVYSPLLRVNLTPQPAATATIACDGPWELRPVGSDRVLARGERLAETQATATAAGLQIGQTSHPVARLELHATSSPAIWVNDHQYRGSVRLFRRPEQTLIAVNVVSLEEYVGAVVDGEMPASFPDEARKTQAVLARSFALFRMAEAAGHPEFDLYATTRSQKYLGFQYRTAEGRRLAGESENSRRCARETAGVVCTTNGRVFSTYYCAVCGGGTIDGTRVFSDAADVIRGVRCEWCRESELYRWTEEISKPEAARVLRAHFISKGEPFGALKTLSRPGPDDGPATLFEADDGTTTRTISAAELRRILPSSVLHSPFFTVRSEGDAFMFSGRGHGHGVGVCQWGARGLALKKKSCFQILEHYYPGVKFVVVAPPAQ